MSRTGHHRKHPGRDLWARRPCSGWSHCALHKRICRRIERRTARQALRVACERGEELP
jgi:hypothetical protein